MVAVSRDLTAVTLTVHCFTYFIYLFSNQLSAVGGLPSVAGAMASAVAVSKVHRKIVETSALQ